MPNDFYDHQNAQNEGVVLASTLSGTPVAQQTAAQAQMAGDPNIRPATGWSTAPYKVPPPEVSPRRDEQGRVLCSVEDCKGFSSKAYPYCAGHAMGKGLTKPRKTTEKAKSDEHAS